MEDESLYVYIWDSIWDFDTTHILRSNEGLGKSVQMYRLAQALTACVHKVWIKMKT